nr:hypothetical protein [uncultured Helicobacter sp.]
MSDKSLGNSSLGMQCSSVATFVKGTDSKSANLPQNLQSYHSHTANTRIVDTQSPHFQVSTSLKSQADSATLKVAKHDFATIKINVAHKVCNPYLAHLVVRSFGFKVAVVPPPKRS